MVTAGERGEGGKEGGEGERKRKERNKRREKRKICVKILKFKIIEIQLKKKLTF
jgi:hypothetical protein